MTACRSGLFHVFVCLVVFGYLVGGAFLFRHIERPTSKRGYTRTETLAQLVEDVREITTKEIIAYCIENPDVDYQVAHEEIKGMLYTYHDLIGYAVNRTMGTKHPYKGEAVIEKEYWSILSSVLFTTTTLTTVGYGHVYPVTQTGYVAFLIYAVFAVPLMSMFLVDICSLLMKGVKHCYNRGCCFFIRRKRRVHHSLASLDECRHLWAVPQHYRNPNKAAGPPQVIYAYAYDYEDYLPENSLAPFALAITLLFMFAAFSTVTWRTFTGWTMVESLYFAVTTLLTIGFGDYVPGWTSQPMDEKTMLSCSIYLVIGAVFLTTAAGLGLEASTYRFSRRKGTAVVRRNEVYDNQAEEGDATPPYRQYL